MFLVLFNCIYKNLFFKPDLDVFQSISFFRSKTFPDAVLDGSLKTIIAMMLVFYLFFYFIHATIPSMVMGSLGTETSLVWDKDKNN